MYIVVCLNWESSLTFLNIDLYAYMSMHSNTFVYLPMKHYINQAINIDDKGNYLTVAVANSQ